MSPSRKMLILTMGLAIGAVVVLVVDSLEETMRKPVLLRFSYQPGRLIVYNGSAEVKRFWFRIQDGRPYRLIRETQKRKQFLLQALFSGKYVDFLCDVIDERRLKRYVLYPKGEPEDKTEFRRNLVEAALPLPEFRLVRRNERGFAQLAARRISLPQLYRLLDGLFRLPENQVSVGQEWFGQEVMGVVLVKWRWRLRSLKMAEKGMEAEIAGTVQFFRNRIRLGRADISYILPLDFGLPTSIKFHILLITPSASKQFQLEYEENLTLKLQRTLEIEPESAAKQVSHIESFLSALSDGDGEEVLRQLTAAATSSPPENPILPIYHRLIDEAKKSLERDSIKRLLKELKEGYHHHNHKEKPDSQRKRKDK